MPPLDEPPDTEEERNFAAAIEKVRAADSDVYALRVIYVQMQLGYLGFFGGPFSGTLSSRTRRALIAYQYRSKLNVTGTLTLETLERLNRDVKLATSPPARLPRGRTSVHPEAIFTSGTWVSGAGVDDVPWKLSTVQIECYPELKLCIEANARIGGREVGGELELEVDRWQLAAVTATELISKPRAAACATWVLRVDRQTGEASKTRTFGGYSPQRTCHGLIDAKPWTLRVGSGEEVTERLRRGEPEFLDVLNLTPGVREKLKGGGRDRRP